MDIRKFGAYISKLRKQSDLTQSHLADMLNVTRQAVSKWEMGDSFPDISLLPHLAKIFHVTVDQIINYGEPCQVDNIILSQIDVSNYRSLIEAAVLEGELDDEVLQSLKSE